MNESIDAPTTAEILELAVELSLWSALQCDRSETPEQAERRREVVKKCEAWYRNGYIFTGKPQSNSGLVRLWDIGTK